MKKKIYLLVVLGTISLSAYNVVLSAKMKGNIIDLTLSNIEAIAAEESSSMHGRPLLQSVIDGGYKCANCTGTDCGAIC